MTAPERRATPLGLDDIVAVADILTALTGRPLSPFESSRLKSAYHQAATLSELAAALAA